MGDFKLTSVFYEYIYQFYKEAVESNIKMVDHVNISTLN